MLHIDTQSSDESVICMSELGQSSPRVVVVGELPEITASVQQISSGIDEQARAIDQVADRSQHLTPPIELPTRQSLDRLILSAVII
jgi:methyl-accepting chemotaxis protein